MIPRRGRSTGLGTGTANGNGTFARDAVLREAIKLGVCPEDRARLEALARFAYGTPGFRAVTPISLGEDRARQAVFEVLYTPEGPTARPLDTDRLPPAPSGAAGQGRAATAPVDPAEPPSGSAEPDLPTVLADVASHTPDLMGAFGSTGRKMLWANDSLRTDARRARLGRARRSSNCSTTRRRASSWSACCRACSAEGWWQGQLTLVGPDVEPIAVRRDDRGAPRGRPDRARARRDRPADPQAGAPETHARRRRALRGVGRTRQRPDRGDRAGRLGPLRQPGRVDHARPRAR